MTARDLQDFLIKTLIRTVGGNQRRWKAVIGPIRVYDVATHSHCNWSVSPSGDGQENAALEGLLDRIRIIHPFVEPE